MEQFRQGLKIVDGIWSCVTSLGQRYVCKSSTSPDGYEWVIQCLSLDGKVDLWSKTFSQEQIQKKVFSSRKSILTFPQRNALGIQNLSWDEYFSMFRTSFSKDDIFIASEGPLELNYSYLPFP